MKSKINIKRAPTMVAIAIFAVEFYLIPVLMAKHFITLVLFFTFGTMVSQTADGYWDKERTTTKEIELCAGCRTFIRTDDLPVGTTEVIYRITLLDENQKLAGSLASVLNAIPDPSGISQGSAGAVTLLSKISGQDKARFNIFRTQKDAIHYKNSGEQQLACLVYPTEISKMAGRLTLQNSTCLTPDTRFLWFGFKSSNKLMKQKIVLEVVPWVNKKASRGWTVQARQKFVDDCKAKISVTKQVVNTLQYCNCVLDKVQQKHTAQELQQFGTTERDKIIDRSGAECFVETGEQANRYSQLRKTALALMSEGRFGDAILKYQDIVNGQPTVSDYSNLGYSYIMTKQYLKAIKYLKEGEQVDASDLNIKANLAHAYLLSGDVKLAKNIYAAYSGQNVDEHTSWQSRIETDFDEFRKAALPTNHFKSVLRMVR